jgi:hypothetical protein
MFLYYLPFGYCKGSKLGFLSGRFELIRVYNSRFFLFWQILSTHCRCRALLLHLFTHTHTRSVVLLWTRDRSVAETSILLNKTLTKDIHAPLGGIRTRIPSKQRAAHLVELTNVNNCHHYVITKDCWADPGGYAFWRLRSAAARFLALLVRMPPGAWISVCCWVLRFARYRSLRRADPLSRGVLPNACVCVIDCDTVQQ